MPKWVHFLPNGGFWMLATDDLHGCVQLLPALASSTDKKRVILPVTLPLSEGLGTAISTPRWMRQDLISYMVQHIFSSVSHR